MADIAVRLESNVPKVQVLAGATGRNFAACGSLLALVPSVAL